MFEIKAALFDADGVLALPEEFFSQVYARSRGLEPEPFEQFFRTTFRPARTGKADLKQLLRENNDLWQWGGDPDELLKMWFDAENVKNEPLLEVIREARANGLPCFMATNQEHYRGEYIRSVMFQGDFDEYFVSADLGVEKPNPQFFKQIVHALQERIHGLEPGNITYFDDSQGHIDVATGLGLNAHTYTDVDQVRRLLDDFLKSGKA